MSEAPKRIWVEATIKSGLYSSSTAWSEPDDECEDEQYHHASTLRTVLDMLNSNASRDNIRRVIEAELGSE